MAEASAGSQENVEIGFTPAETSIITLAGTTAGYLEDDIEMDVPGEFATVRAGLTIIQAEQISRDLVVSASCKEVLKGNLRYAWNTDAPSSTVVTIDLDVGAGDQTFALVINTRAPNAAASTRAISVPKAVMAGSNPYTIPRARGGETNQTLALNFIGIGDTSSNGLLGTITDPS